MHGVKEQSGLNHQQIFQIFLQTYSENSEKGVYGTYTQLRVQTGLAEKEGSW